MYSYLNCIPQRELYQARLRVIRGATVRRDQQAEGPEAAQRSREGRVQASSPLSCLPMPSHPSDPSFVSLDSPDELPYYLYCTVVLLNYCITVCCITVLVCAVVL